MNPTENLEKYRDYEFVDPGVMIQDELQLLLEKTVPYNPVKKYVPAYHFLMVNVKTKAMMGKIDLRVGLTEKLKEFGGHIGYQVDEAHRGNRYAAQSCRLLVPLLRKLRINPVVITCDPSNLPSVKTIESLGATLIFTKIVETEAGVFRITSNYHWQI